MKEKKKKSLYIIFIIGIVIISIFLLNHFIELKEDRKTINIQVEFENFVNKVRNTGKITNDDYNDLMSKLISSGDSYELSIGIQKLDEYTTNKIYDEDTQVGENIYYETYTGQVLDSLNSTGTYLLQEGSIIKIELVNSKNKEIVATQSGTVTVNGN